MPGGSNDLWYSSDNLLATINIECLLPNGILTALQCKRDITLETLKAMVFTEALRLPLNEKLDDVSKYVFVGVTKDGELESYYDETRRLSDLRLFCYIFRLEEVDKWSNKEEAMINANIAAVLNIPQSEFNPSNDLEVMTFRRELFNYSKDVVDHLEADIDSRMAYAFPSELVSEEALIDFAKSRFLSKAPFCVTVYLLMQRESDNNSYGVTVDLPVNATPKSVIAEVVRKGLRLEKNQIDVETIISEFQRDCVLKACGRTVFFIDECPIINYRYILNSVMKGTTSSLLLVDRRSLVRNLPESSVVEPRYLQQGVSALEEACRLKTFSAWSYESNLQIRVNCATHLNVKEGMELFVRIAIFLGSEPLCVAKQTKKTDTGATLRWNETLDFDIFVSNLPRYSRLCIDVCAMEKGYRKKKPVVLAYGVLNMWDFMSRLLCGKRELSLWPTATSQEKSNPLSIPISNPNVGAPCLEIEMHKDYTMLIEIPSRSEFLEMGHQLMLQQHQASHGSTERDDDASVDREIKALVDRDPFTEFSEQEKHLLWRKRRYCRGSHPDALPQILASVKWNNRSAVSELYVMLKAWPSIRPAVALELLNVTYSDPYVREFAVNCLHLHLPDDQLCFYLPQLVQILKLEPYLDNDLVRFLLSRALMNQTVGHFLFWHLNAELYDEKLRMRFGLILEVYLRNCGSYMIEIMKQVECLNKLTILSNVLKEKDDEQRFFVEYIQRDDFLDVLENLRSPLLSVHQLGSLLLDECKVLKSKKKPLWLVWRNADQLANPPSSQKAAFPDLRLIFKNGDDLRQDMLTLQIIWLMDKIWKVDGLDMRMNAYRVLATGKDTGFIEVVRDAKTLGSIKRQNTVASLGAPLGADNKLLYSWMKSECCGDERRIDEFIENFTYSCAGYCVATFVLGVRDRHADNIMVSSKGHIVHIDFGHFLDHKKKKFGYLRERVPFVLTEDFIKVITKSALDPKKCERFRSFKKLCRDAYLSLRKNARLFLVLFSLMLPCGIPELRSQDDIEYLRESMALGKNEEEAMKYFDDKFEQAYLNQFSVKVDSVFHFIRNRNS